MAICEICYNTGKIEGVGYCGCVEGRSLKRGLEIANEVAKRSEVKVTAKKKQPATVSMDITAKYEHDFTSNHLYQEGDWVIIKPKFIRGIKGVKGYVLSTEFNGARVRTVGLEKHGFPNYEGFMHNECISPTGREIFDLDILIDLALQTKDEEWFKQLTRGME